MKKSTTDPTNYYEIGDNLKSLFFNNVQVNDFLTQAAIAKLSYTFALESLIVELAPRGEEQRK